MKNHESNKAMLLKSGLTMNFGVRDRILNANFKSVISSNWRQGREKLSGDRFSACGCHRSCCAENDCLSVIIKHSPVIECRNASGRIGCGRSVFGGSLQLRKEDLNSCQKNKAASIDTVDKKIVRTLKAFKIERLERDESRI